MKCPSCGTENKNDAKFCKACGGTMSAQYKTCKNGHNYDSSLNDCPYCPNPNVARVIEAATENQKTVIDKAASVKTTPDIEDFEHSPDVATTPPKNMPPAQKTVITTQSPAINEQVNARLAGWLVSFDIDPMGKEFRLYEGRNKIGRADNCTVTVDDSSVSEEHALLYVKDNKVLLQDELSTNGTFVNGRKIEERVSLNDNDKVRFGNIGFKIKII